MRPSVACRPTCSRSCGRPSSCAWCSRASTPTWACTSSRARSSSSTSRSPRSRPWAPRRRFLVGFDLESRAVLRAGARGHAGGRARPGPHAESRAPRIAGGGDRRRLRGVLGGGGAARHERAPRRRASPRHARRQHSHGERRRRRQGGLALRGSSALSTGVPAPVLPDLHRSRGRLRARAGGCAAWDFLFYASFGVVVTSSVRIAGVLLVFSYLIVPALAGVALGRTVARAARRSAGASAPW